MAAIAEEVTQEFQFHRAANIFPLISGEAFESLVVDIKNNGLKRPIELLSGDILDGRNRYRACLKAGIEPEFIEYSGDDSIPALVAHVRSLNKERRHLDSFQLATCAALAEELLGKERAAAKERQDQTKRLERNNRGQLKPVPEKVQEVDKHERESATKVAKEFGTNSNYLRKAIKLKKENPEVFEKAHQGDVGYKDVAKLDKKLKEEKREEISSSIDIETEEAGTLSVEEGQWWKLGEHLLYCGDTSQEAFYSKLPKTPFAFADPPYNAKVDAWDQGFVWAHDYLADLADVSIVTPGIVSLFEFARITHMPYRWSIACWIANGMTRGAMGFGNWIYGAVFAHGSVYRNSQDFTKVSINVSSTQETNHRGRKPSEFIAWLLEIFTTPGQAVIDPFLGSGTTLLVAEKVGRVCFGGEINPGYCAAIIERWEGLSGGVAELVSEN